jgi:hypothetical protein
LLVTVKPVDTSPQEKPVRVDMEDRASPEDGQKWGREVVSPFGVVAYVKRGRIKRTKADWNRCMTCGGKMEYKPGKGRFCTPKCRTAFDDGYEPPQEAEDLITA